METKSILVQTDLSLSGKCALNHAFALAQASGAALHLLYNVRRNRDIPAAKVTIYAIAEEVAQRYKGEVHRLVRVGPAWQTTAQAAEEVNADLVVMGSAMVAGLPKLFGHPALKLFDSCCRPFVVVQEKEVSSQFNRIVVPVNPAHRFDRQLQVAAELARSCEASIHLLGRPADHRDSRSLLSWRLELGRRFLRKKGIQLTTEIAPGKQAFAQEVLNYAQHISADLITVLHLPEQRYWFRGFEPQILTNDQQIPALVVSANQS